MDASLLQLFSAEEILRRLGEKESTGTLHVFTAKESANVFFREGLVVGAVKGLLEGDEVVRQLLEWENAHFMWQADVQAPPTLTKPMEVLFPDLLNRIKAAPMLDMIGKTRSGSLPRNAAAPEGAAGPKAKTETKTAPVPPDAPLPPEIAAAFKSAKIPTKEEVEAVATFKSARLPARPKGRLAETTTLKGAPVPPAAPTEAPAVVKSSRLPSTKTEGIATRPPAAAPEAPAEPAEPAPVPAQAALTATKNIHPETDARVSHEESLLKKYKLVLISTGAQPDRKMRLVRISSLVGRNPACDFTLDHPSVSRQHCLLQITDRGLHVKDLGTTNGTKVNGIVLTEGYINVDDKLTMGHLSFFLEWDEDPVF